MDLRSSYLINKNTNSTIFFSDLFNIIEDLKSICVLNNIALKLRSVNKLNENPKKLALIKDLYDIVFDMQYISDNGFNYDLASKQILKFNANNIVSINLVNLILTDIALLSNFNPIAINFFNRLPDAPTIQQKNAINSFIIGVLSDENTTNLTSLFSKIHIRGLSRANGLINLVSSSFNSVEGFSTTLGWGKAGFKNDPVLLNSYLKESWNPSIDGGTIYDLNQGGVGIYFHTNGTDDGFTYGAYGSNGVNGMIWRAKRIADSSTALFANNSGSGSSSNVGLDIDGFNFNIRTNSNTVLRTRNGVLIETLTSASVAMSDKELYTLGCNGNGTPVNNSIYQQSFFCISKGSINWVAFSARVETLMKALGCSTTQVKNAYIFGDSITAGFSNPALSSVFQRYSTILSMLKGWNEINFGVSGSTLQNASPLNYYGGNNMYDQMSSIPTFNSAKDAKIIIAFGVNDVRAFEAGQTNYTSTNAANQLGTIIDNAISKGWSSSDIIVICGTYVNLNSWVSNNPTNYINFQNAIQTKADAKNVVFVNPYSYMSNNGGNSLLSDNLHPNAAGYSLLGNYYNSVIL